MGPLTSVDIVVELVLDQSLDDIDQIPYLFRLFNDHFAKDQHTHHDVDNVVKEGVEGGIDTVVHIEVFAGEDGEV